MNFADLGLAKPILKAVAEQGYETPSPIQEKAIPEVLEGHDLMAAAQTGTGKTAGFVLPVLNHLHLNPLVKRKPKAFRALVVTPTRELAAQIFDNTKKYSKHTKLNHDVVFGGVGIHPQIRRLNRGGDMLISTPGRLLDLHKQKAINLEHIEVLVLDEADRMLDMGFIHDIRRINQLLPEDKQTLMFSATFAKEIKKLAKGMMRSPVEVSVTPPNSTVKTVTQSIISVDQPDKQKVLTGIIKEQNWYQVLVFSRTKHGANRIAKKLEAQGIKSAAIHGNKSQNARTRALADFKNNKVRVLVATDIAARGIDISELPHVVNFDLPNVPEDYVHRIGRTGRAGSEGEAVSLVSYDEGKLLRDIQRLIGMDIPRQTLSFYQPEKPLPESLEGMRAPKKTRGRNNSRPSSSNRSKPSGGRGRSEGRSSERRNGDNKPKRARRTPNPQGKREDGPSTNPQGTQQPKKKHRATGKNATRKNVHPAERRKRRRARAQATQNKPSNNA